MDGWAPYRPWLAAADARPLNNNRGLLAHEGRQLFAESENYPRPSVYREQHCFE